MAEHYALRVRVRLVAIGCAADPSATASHLFAAVTPDLVTRHPPKVQALDEEEDHRHCPACSLSTLCHTAAAAAAAAAADRASTITHKLISAQKKLPVLSKKVLNDHEK